MVCTCDGYLHHHQRVDLNLTLNLWKNISKYFLMGIMGIGTT